VILEVAAFNEKWQGKRNPDGNLVGILLEIKDGPVYQMICFILNSSTESNSILKLENWLFSF